VPVKKNKRGRIIEEGSSAAHEATKLCATIWRNSGAAPRYYDGVPMQAWESGAAMPHQILRYPM
jgi:hypothetical protein